MTEKSTAMRNKQRLLKLLRYLYENTDEEHPVKTPELVEIFSDQNAHAKRKTLQDDIQIDDDYTAMFASSRTAISMNIIYTGTNLQKGKTIRNYTQLFR